MMQQTPDINQSGAGSIRVQHLPYWLLALGIAVGLTLLGVRASACRIISHDDGISYIAATCHQYSYGEQTPQGRWVPAEEWQAFWTPDRFGCFQEISRGLALRDIHPPLYFWILHVWLHIVGLDVATGFSLNIILHGLITLAIFMNCRLFHCCRLSSAVGAVLWLLSGSSLLAANNARQYSLLALATVLFVAAVVLFLRDGKPLGLLFLCVLACVGLLTHYHFFIVLGTLAAWAGAFLIRRGQSRRTLMLMIAVGLGVVFMVLLHPGFLESFYREMSRVEEFSKDRILGRLSRCIFSWLQLLLPIGPLTPLSPGLTFGVRLGLAAYVWAFFLIAAVGKGFDRQNRFHALSDLHALPWAAVVGIGAAISALYVFQVSPAHAMGPRYLLAVGPIVFIVIAQLVDRLSSRRIPRVSWLLALLLISQLVNGVWSTLTYADLFSDWAQPAYVKRQGPLVLDTTARGVLPGVLWDVSPDSPVYAASQEHMLASFPEIPDWMDTLSYVSDLRYHDNSTEAQRKIIALLQRNGYKLVDTEHDVMGADAVFVVQDTTE